MESISRFGGTDGFPTPQSHFDPWEAGQICSLVLSWPLGSGDLAGNQTLFFLGEECLSSGNATSNSVKGREF
jgi:hypothetical protein